MKPTHLLAAVTALVLTAAAGVTAATLRQEAAAPTDGHRWLTSHAGTWDSKADMMGMQSAGTYVIERGPGDLWTVSTFEGEMMGAPFQGKEFMGYDPESKTYTSIWIDSSSPYAMTMTGTYDAATKTLTSKGVMKAPGGMEMPMTSITRYPDADHMSYEMRTPGEGGEEMTMMTIEYTRRK